MLKVGSVSSLKTFWRVAQAFLLLCYCSVVFLPFFCVRFLVDDAFLDFTTKLESFRFTHSLYGVVWLHLLRNTILLVDC